MLSVLSRAVNGPATYPGAPTAIAAFGSFGRLDGSPEVSDYDSLFLYDGTIDAVRVAQIHEFIKTLLKSNRALPFDHRDEIEAGIFDFARSPAYPVLSATELLTLTDGFEIRALQLLTEGRVLTGKDFVVQLRQKILESYGYRDNVHALDFSKLRDALGRLKKAYCTGVIGRLVTDKRPLTNRKILKLFALREFSFLAALFALAEVSIRISAKACDHHEAASILSAPSVLKIASFSNPISPFANLLIGFSPEIREGLCERLQFHAKRLNADAKFLTADTGADAGETVFCGYVRALTLHVLRKFDGLIQLLHDPAFLKVLDALQPDVTTWVAVKQFQRILQIRGDLIAASIELASALSDVLDEIAKTKGCAALDDARCSLQCIIDYKLELALGAAA